MAHDNDDGLVKLRGKTYFENFTVEGIRYRGSLKTGSLDTAIIIATKRKSDLQLAHLIGKPPEKKEMTLDVALGRHWLEVGHALRSAKSVGLACKVLLAGLGGGTRLSEITLETLATYAAKRRLGQITHVPNSRRAGVRLRAATVNIDLVILRSVINRARDVWGVNVATIKWKLVLLPGNNEQQHILGRREAADDPSLIPNEDDEETRLFNALRPDYHDFVRFGLLTGIRLGNIYSLTWRQVKWSDGLIELRVKSKEPEGKLHYVPIKPSTRAILEAQRGRHKTRVFTYVCRRNNHKGKRKEGHRYPILESGFRHVWMKAVQNAGLFDYPRSPDNFRFHDLRHTAATRALKKSGNLKAVQKLLGHAKIEHTARYAKTDIEDVRDAMD